MLPRPKRLNLKKEFRAIASGQKIEDQYFKIFLKSGSNDQAKIGISVAKAIFKTAVDRNRARRLASTGIEGLYDKLPSQINLIIMPKKESLTLTSDQTKDDLEIILKRNGVF